MSTWFGLSFVRSYNFGWSPVYDCKAYLETNTVQNCSYFGLVDIFLVSRTTSDSRSDDFENPLHLNVFFLLVMAVPRQ